MSMARFMLYDKGNSGKQFIIYTLRDLEPKKAVFKRDILSRGFQMYVHIFCRGTQ